MKHVLFVILILYMGLSFAVSADPNFMVYGGLMLPMSDFHEDDRTSSDGYSGNGIGAGLKFSYPVKRDYLDWISDIQLLFNFLDHDEIDVIDGPDGGHYLNIPITTGLLDSKVDD